MIGGIIGDIFSSNQGSVPEVMIEFIDSKDYDDAIRKEISLGGDSETIE